MEIKHLLRRLAFLVGGEITSKLIVFYQALFAFTQANIASGRLLRRTIIFNKIIINSTNYKGKTILKIKIN